MSTISKKRPTPIDLSEDYSCTSPSYDYAASPSYDPASPSYSPNSPYATPETPLERPRKRAATCKSEGLRMIKKAYTPYEHASLTELMRETNLVKKQKLSLRFLNEAIKEFAETLLPYGCSKDYDKAVRGIEGRLNFYIRDFHSVPCLFADSDGEDINTDSESDE